MELQVELGRSKARRLATKHLPPDSNLDAALAALRSWALTMDMDTEGTVSWLLPSQDEIEIRVPMDDTTEVHPSEGMEVKRVPSQYRAEVDVPDETIEPQHVATVLGSWADDAGFSVQGDYEVFTRRLEPGYRLAVPIKKRVVPPTIEV